MEVHFKNVGFFHASLCLDVLKRKGLDLFYVHLNPQCEVIPLRNSNCRSSHTHAFTRTHTHTHTHMHCSSPGKMKPTHNK